MYTRFPTLNNLFPLGRTKQRNCTLTTKNPYYQHCHGPFWMRSGSQIPLNAIFFVCNEDSYSRLHLTTIPVELGFLGDFILLKLKTCPLYLENLSRFIPQCSALQCQFCLSKMAHSNSSQGGYIEVQIYDIRTDVSSSKTKTEGHDFQ